METSRIPSIPYWLMAIPSGFAIGTIQTATSSSIAPASEAETAALVRLTEEVKPVLTISYHATGSVIYWDYGQTGELRERCESMVKKISQVNGNEIRYAASDKQDAAGYGDWCVMSKGIPSATIEIGVGTAPLGISEYSDIWKRN